MPQRRRSAAITSLLLLLSGLCLIAGGCQREKPTKPNVLVVVIDTLRADHVGAYGYGRDTSPALDALATEGVAFETAVTAAPRTWQSFTSILTGLYPPHHHVRFIFDHPLAPTIPTLATILADHGYATAAFDGMTFLRGMTGGKSFQEYVDPQSLHGDMLGDDKVGDAFLGWLDKTTHRPFFAFIRLGAPHWPYIAPPAFHGQVQNHGALDHGFNAGTTGIGIDREGLTVTDADAYRKRFFDYDYPPEVLEHMRLHYDECVRYSDGIVGGILARLRTDKLFDSTLIVVTADHGESLGEHHYLQHGTPLYDPVMLVPLIVKFPLATSLRRTGVRVPQLVRTIDIAPTIIAALGFTPPRNIDGVNLLPAIDGGASLQLSAYGEGGRGFVGLDPELHLPGVTGKWRMLRTARWKLLYIPGAEGGTYRLYDLTNDPSETTDASAEHPDVAGDLRRKLAAIMAQETAVPSAESTLTEQQKERLRALGYL
jgi:arylsulfatase A-like enzyme